MIKQVSGTILEDGVRCLELLTIFKTFLTCLMMFQDF